MFSFVGGKGGADLGAFTARAKKKRLAVTWSMRCKIRKKKGSKDAQNGSRCPGNERCEVVFLKISHPLPFV